MNTELERMQMNDLLQKNLTRAGCGITMLGCLLPFIVLVFIFVMGAIATTCGIGG